VSGHEAKATEVRMKLAQACSCGLGANRFGLHDSIEAAARVAC